MRKLTLLLMATAMTGAVTTMAIAADSGIPSDALTKPVVAKGTPRGADGHADLTGVWTNVSITPLTRRPQYGNNKIMSRDEALKLEGAAIDRFAEGNKPTPVTVGSLDNTSKNCQGAGGLDCGYNSGWKDSGTAVSWVNGEPRTSFITYPVNGQMPARVAGAAPARRPTVEELGEGAGPPAAPAARPAAPAGGAGGATAAAGGRGAGGRGGAAGGGRGGGGGGGVRNAASDNPETEGSGVRCLTSFGNSQGPVMLPLMYNNNYAFVQTKDAIAIEVEMVHDVRTIRLNTKHRTDGVRPWFGNSIGHWEGDTLVAETTNFPAAQNFQGSDQNLKVTEKFTRVNKNHILYQFIAEDPTVWVSPVAGEYEFSPTNGLIYEYACHEGNYAMEGMLAGAREDERQAAENANKPRAAATPAGAPTAR